jgi:hypothetical protein
LLVFERLAESGGVQEILTLLDRTRAGLRSGVVGREQVAGNLARARRALAVYADHLTRMVRVCPLEELIAERRHHRDTGALLEDARDVVRLVAGQFPTLAAAGQRLVGEALRYSAAVGLFIERLLDAAAAQRDFSMLDEEQYRTAALTAARDDLAAVFARTVFDPPSLWIDPDLVIGAVDGFRPRAAAPRRPPRPPDPPPGPDPIDQARERADATRRRRLRAAEDLLQGDSETDLTSRLRAAGWPAAAQLVAGLLAADADPKLPYQVELSNALLVDADAPVTHLTPLILRRAAAPNDGPASTSVHERERSRDA